MITEDHLAAATIAKIFGGELLKVQENARTDSGNVPTVVKMHPRDFLAAANNSPNKAQQQKLEQQRLLQALQREAEAACPLPQEPVAPPPVAPPPVASVPAQASVVVPQTMPVVQQQTSLGNNDPWMRIAVALENISAKLDTIDFTVTKRKRKKVAKRETNI